MNNKTDGTLECQVGQELLGRNWRLITAESCTGGLLGHRLTNVPGSSYYYLGGFISYAYEAKQAWLGVNPQTLVEFGAVSCETVRAMAAGARAALVGFFDPSSVVAISVSGIAGPDGGTQQKPVGTVWLGIDGPLGSDERLLRLYGNREEIKEQTAQNALEWLFEYCKRREN